MNQEDMLPVLDAIERLHAIILERHGMKRPMHWATSAMTDDLFHKMHRRLDEVRDLAERVVLPDEPTPMRA